MGRRCAIRDAGSAVPSRRGARLVPPRREVAVNSSRNLQLICSRARSQCVLRKPPDIIRGCVRNRPNAAYGARFVVVGKGGGG